MSGLLNMQRAFRAAVLGSSDGGLADGLHAPRGGIAARLAIYRNTVQASLGDVLAAAFPVVQRIVGEFFFSDLCRRYIAAHPPRRPHLSVYGADFPTFIAADARVGELPYLADTARLEWARGEAYFAADAAPLNPAALTRVPDNSLAAIGLSLHPALRLVRSAYPVARIWRLNQPEISDVPAVDMTVAENVLISRPTTRVIVREIGAGDAAFVTALEAGAPLGEAVGQAQEEDPAFALEDALRDHLINGSFAEIR